MNNVGELRNRESAFLIALTIKQRVMDHGAQVVMVRGKSVYALSLSDPNTDDRISETPWNVAGTFNLMASGREIADAILYTHKANKEAA